MEVGVVLAGQRMQTLKYQTISTMHFFMSIRTEISLLNIMGSLAGSEERSVVFCTTEHMTTINTTPQKHHFLQGR